MKYVSDSQNGVQCFRDRRSIKKTRHFSATEKGLREVAGRIFLFHDVTADGQAV
jgi:hypothetical protein